MHWHYRDQLRQTDLGGGGTTCYVYDDAQRVRKVWEKSANLIEERIYLGGFEIFRRRNGAGADMLERETLHIMDDQQRIALVETRTVDTTSTDTAPPQLIRYQFGNHLGSASLELDDQAQITDHLVRGIHPIRQHVISGGTQPDRDAQAVSVHGQGAR